MNIADSVLNLVYIITTSCDSLYWLLERKKDNNAFSSLPNLGNVNASD